MTFPAALLYRQVILEIVDFYVITGMRFSESNCY